MQAREGGDTVTDGTLSYRDADGAWHDLPQCAPAPARPYAERSQSALSSRKNAVLRTLGINSLLPVQSILFALPLQLRMRNRKRTLSAPPLTAD